MSVFSIFRASELAVFSGSRRNATIKRKAKPRGIQIESLEKRELLAASIFYNTSTRVLSITGTAANDSAEVRLSSAGGISVRTWDSNSQDTKTFGAGVQKIVFFGREGNDYFRNFTNIPVEAWGGPGNDTLYGGGGHDRLMGESGNDLIFGGAGNDKIWGGDGDDQLVGEEGDDELMGGSGNDSIWGGTGNDKIWGEAGNDRLMGGAGNDQISGGTGDDMLWGGDGNDLLWGNEGHDQLMGDAGNDQLVGGSGNDRLWGGAGDDWLWGDDGNDVLYGGDGNDRLDGGAGNDQMHGGNGYDVAWSSEARETMSGIENVNISLRSGSPQSTNTCGPNSAWRVMGAHGGIATIQQLIDSASERSIVSKWNLGTVGATLVNSMNANARGLGRYRFSLKTRSSFDQVINHLKEGRPVVAMIRNGTQSHQISGGILGQLTRISIPTLHWIAVDGFDSTNQRIFYTETNGVRYSMSYNDFKSAFNWSSSSVANTFLQGLGVVPRTFIV